MADAHYENPRLAALYDPLDRDRPDLEVYAALAAEFGARTVLDIGCGTGTFACLLAARGFAVTGLDPALASLDIARSKPFADRVRWVHGSAGELPPLRADLVTMTGNVAQVFLTDEDWAAVLGAAYAALRPGGLLVFETRDPARQAWRGWDSPRTGLVVPGIGGLESWREVTDVSGAFVSFRVSYVFASDGALLTADSTLRFRGRDEVAGSLAAAGFTIEEIRDAPDRPGLEFVFIATRPPESADRPPATDDTPPATVTTPPGHRRLLITEVSL